jgi:hypothetical protein
MSGQADTLQQLISRFKLKSNSSFGHSLPAARPPKQSAPAVENHNYTGLDDTSGFGKY